MVYRLALSVCGSRADAEEIVQETYVRVWRNMDSLRDRNAVLGWLYRICRNTATDRRRSLQRRKASSLDNPVGDGLSPLVDFIAGDTPTPEQELASAQARTALMKLLQTLRPKHREVLLLRDVEGMPSEQVAEVLGCPVGTVESRLHRARAALASKFERLTRQQAREHR